MIAYDANDGNELWRADCMSGEVGPSPVFADGVVYVANEACGMYAVRVDGDGDVTDSHIDWFTDFDVPDVCSPLVTDSQVLLLSHGLLAAFDAPAMSRLLLHTAADARPSAANACQRTRQSMTRCRT